MTDSQITVTTLTQTYADAVAYASIVHAAQTRKGNGIPYIAHLLGVSSLVIEAGGDEEMAIAGLLHDVAEDQGGAARLFDIEQRFGARVARIVRSCSDTLVADRADKEAYWPRKKRYLAHLATVDRNTAIVAIADKVHNARALHVDVIADGPKTFARFNGSSRLIVRYNERCLAIARQKDLPRELIVPLETAIRGIKRGIERGSKG